MIHKGQVGAIIRLTSTFDLSSASSLSIRYIKPSGTRGEWTGTLSGTTNVQYYTTAATDLDESGRWTFQGFATYANGNMVMSKQVTDEIGRVIEV